mmetsp:Transcript_8920/g.18942  ORF Transcript_8920/g.18942 Transcript_8920/m.18942 type:complete len:170 (+) Transcript_8920:42-551(+)
MALRGGFGVLGRCARVAQGGGVAGRGRWFASEALASDKLRLNFVVPHKAIKDNALVDMVVIPASSGVMGVLPQHAPTVAQLRPGVVAVQDGDSTERYFISSGFAFVHADRTDVCAVEAVPVDDIDPAAVTKGLAECEAKMASASSDLDRAEAQIGVEVYLAMQSAVSEK